MKSILGISFILAASSVFATPQNLRWTGSEDSNDNLTHVIEVLNAKSGLNLQVSDFQSFEDRQLATSHFRMYWQVAAGKPIRDMSLRIWSNKAGLIQAEALVDTPPTAPTIADRLAELRGLSRLREARLQKALAARIQISDDPAFGRSSYRDVWQNGQLVRVTRTRGKRGVHEVVLSLKSAKVLDYRYREFPQADLPPRSAQAGEFSLPALVYPIYEESGVHDPLLPRVNADLRYLQNEAPHVTSDPFVSLRGRRYLEEKQDDDRGATAAGQADGYWSMKLVNQEATELLKALPLSPNDFSHGGVLLHGRFATVSIHPDAPAAFPGLNFTPGLSDQFFPDFKPTPEDADKNEYILQNALLGKPLMSMTDALDRPARRLPDHNPAGYMNDGFDEVQVYYSINTLFEALGDMGWTDDELSTRPFNAFLYNPDISMRDNAFYDSDTINFTTYSPEAPNYARDNSTIWHELGHGVMDRMMGPELNLADTGGLSEGMADFVAQLVIDRVTEGQAFPGSQDLRIINRTGFYLTNESHDDGEAYGGAMQDLLLASLNREGVTGVAKVTDLTLEAMRLTRNHPALTAKEWFGHMLFADQLGHDGVRAPGELRSLIVSALEGRNFDLDSEAPASMTLKNESDNVVITDESFGSRGHPNRLTLAPEETKTFALSVTLKDGDAYRFEYPVTIKARFNGGPLEGAVHWAGEEAGAQTITLNSPTDVANFNVTATGVCDYSNREDGSCSDFIYVEVWNAHDTRWPSAKKRFYVRVKKP